MSVIIDEWENSSLEMIHQPVMNFDLVDNTIAISSVKKKYRLEELLVGVTPDLIDGEYNWDEPVGKEVW